jgi:hypothetical protein
MLGRNVFHAETKGAFTVDLRDQETGLYIVRLSNANGASETKLVVQ